MNVQLLTLDPAHFHAALIHKEILPGISPLAHVFAPLGADLITHLNRLIGFNTRPNNPTRWEVEVHAASDFRERLLKNPPGNVVVLAGRNHTKIDSMLACVEAGLHVLADKPWIIRHADFPKLELLLKRAREKRVLVFDIMTERHEITSILQRELIRDRDLFGELIPGDAKTPAVEMVSVHAIKKQVSGVALKRPAAFFDISQNGEGLTDVGTHLVDLTFWMIAPDRSIDYRNDLRVLSAERWPTLLTRDEYQHVTGEANFPACANKRFAYYCNNRVRYDLLGHHIHLDIRWDLELPAGDTHCAEFRGTRSRVRISQHADRPAPPELDVIPANGANRDAIHSALEARIDQPSRLYKGLRIEERDGGFRIMIPNEFRVGHEAHFSQVTAEFLRYLARPEELPPWEMPNLLAKYFVTTEGVRIAQEIERGRR
jgi:predicted dehydrogenase